MSLRVKVDAANFTGEERKKYVTRMFDGIAEKYDFLNHVLSFGVDIIWRKKATKRFEFKNDHIHLDLATGTGDFAFEVAKNNVQKVIGLDISSEMIKIANSKKLKFKAKVDFDFMTGDAENLPFEDNSINTVSIGFGIRNFGNKKKALDEIFRVLKKDGQLVILEFAKNRTFLIGPLFNFYFKHILPKIGSLFSKDKEAYAYLPDSVETFPSQDEFKALIKSSGFNKVLFKNYSFGISTMFYGQK